MQYSPTFGSTLFLVSLGLIVWLPYLWPRIGYHFWQSSGPWLANFPSTQYPFAVMRDSCATIGLWSFAYSINLWNSTALMWGTFAVAILASIGWAWFTQRLEGDGEESTSVLLISSAKLTRKEVRQFLHDYGAVIWRDRHPFLGRINYPNGYMWIRFVSCMLNEFDPSEYTGQDQVEVTQHRAKIVEILGDEPRTLVAITVTRPALAPGEQAASKFVLTFAQSWPSVVENQAMELLTPDIIAHAQAQQQPIFQFS